jgi:hypothetical protein
MNPHRELPPSKLPDPWLFDTTTLLTELARIRELALHIPPTRNEQHGAIQTVIDAIWHLEGNLRYLVQLHSAAQAAFRAKTTHTQLPQRQTPTRRRQAGARTANARAGH